MLRRITSQDRKALGLKTGEERLEAARNERDLQKQIVAYLRILDIEVIWHSTHKKSTAVRGTPDILFAVKSNGFVCACAWEIKFGRGVPSSEQTDMMHRMQNSPNSWRVRIIRSFSEAVEELREMNL